MHLRTILENSSNLLYTHTTDHVLTYLSPQVEQVLGYKREEAMVRWTELASSNPVNEAGFHHTQRAIDTGEIQPPYELELVRKDGEKIWVEVREYPRVVDGRTVEIIGTLTDITRRKLMGLELKKSRDRFQRIIDGLGDRHCIFTHTPEGVFRFASGGFKALFDVRAEEIIGKNWREIRLTEESIRRGEETDLQILKDGRYHNVELECLHGDGTSRIIEVYYGPVVEDGKIVSLEGICSDITDRRRTENALRNSLRENRDLLRELQHRVKNSFMMVESMISLISHSSKEAAVTSALESIRNRVNAVSKMYSLLYSSDSVSDVLLNRYLADVAGGMENHHSGVRIRTELETMIAPVKKAIPAGMIVVELITNALKHAFSGDEEGEIRLELRTDENGVLIRVADNGRGFPGGGAGQSDVGMGLHLVRSLVKQLGGEADFFNDAGAVVRIVFEL